MPLTFGAATSDRVSFTSISSGVANTTNFAACWFNASTLTAGRYILAWTSGSATNLAGVRIGTTTSTLQLVAGATTTLGVWTATADATLFPSGVTTNQWFYLAVAETIATGPTIQYVAWLGTESIPPTPMTIATTTSPAGTPSGGANVVVGNNIITSPTAAFQGDIGQIIVISHPTGSLWQIPNATAGTFTTDEQLLIQQSIVIPLWLGQTYGLASRDGSTAASVETFDGISAGYRQQLIGASASGNLGITITGATVSQTQTPRQWRHNLPLQPYPVSSSRR